MMQVKEKNFVSVVLYVNNDADDIEDFILTLNQVFDRNFEKYEFICVNDFSTDDTKDVIKQVSKKLNGVVISLINMSYYHGVESAMHAGVDLAIGDFIFEFDQIAIDYDLETIIKVYRKALSGFDIVSASPRNVERISSRLFYAIFNKFFYTNYKIRAETFRVLSRRAVNRVHSRSKTIPYRKALYANCGLNLYSIIYDNFNIMGGIQRRQDVREKAKRRDMAIDSLILFTDVAYKVTFSLAVFMMFASLIIGIYAIVVFVERTPVAGWTTTILFLAFGFFGLFCVLAIIIKYLAILIDLVFKKQSYTTESVEKMTNC